MRHGSESADTGRDHTWRLMSEKGDREIGLLFCVKIFAKKSRENKTTRMT